MIPYGFTNAVSTIFMPYLLRKNGVAVDQIAGVVAISTLPAIWSFLCRRWQMPPALVCFPLGVRFRPRSLTVW